MSGAPPWVRTARPEAAIRLFCFPYAGGGSADFRAWTEGLSSRIDVCPVVLPGRETRLSERAFDDVGAAVAAALPALLPLMRQAPFAFYGHSMGAWVAFELARALRRAGGRLAPIHLFLGARRAPDRPARLPAISDLPEPLFIDAVQQRYGGIPEAVRSQPDLMRLFLPTLRADFALLDRYRYVDEPPLPIPITALHGEEDPMENAADAKGWAVHTSAGFDFRSVPGGHFFLRDSRDLVTAVIDGHLGRARPRSG